MPILREKKALVLIIVLSFVASRAERHGADERASSQKVKNIPDELARESLVTREDLAL
jgi:hypothetical protein